MSLSGPHPDRARRRKFRSSVLFFALWLLLTVLGGAEESKTRLTMPDPMTFGRPDSVAIFVVRARVGRAGFRHMLSTALDGAAASGVPTLGQFLGSQTQREMVLSALPFQWVRVDGPAQQGVTSSSIAITVAGWRGLQGLVYDALLKTPDGQPYPVSRYLGEEIIQRPKSVLTRVKGTFLQCADASKVRPLIERMVGRDSRPLSGPLWDCYRALDKDRDGYGALVNRDESLLQVLQWVYPAGLESLREALGRQRVDRAAAIIRTGSWEAEVKSDDRVDLQLRLHTANWTEAKELAVFLGQAYQVLVKEGRIRDFTVTIAPREVRLSFGVVGFREVVSGFLATVRL